MMESSPAAPTSSHEPIARAPGAARIRPWYRSRFFWAGIPGLLFLLWAWWDSGAYHSHATSMGKGGLYELNASLAEGSLEVKWKRRDPLSVTGPSIFSAGRWKLSDDPHSGLLVTPRPRQFDVARSLWIEKEMDGLGKNPAAAGWVPSPGRKLPVAKLVHFEGAIALWLLVLVYLLAGTLFLACWQYWKARRRERRGGPRPVISLGPWLPFLLLLALTACFFDSFHTRTRGWVGNEKYHAGWSHHRGLFTVSLFHEPLAADGADLDGEFFREPMRDGGLTPRRWPRWIGPDAWHENAWELRVPTLFVLEAFLFVWLGMSCLRWQRRRARLRKLHPPPG